MEVHSPQFAADAQVSICDKAKGEKIKINRLKILSFILSCSSKAPKSQFSERMFRNIIFCTYFLFQHNFRPTSPELRLSVVLLES